MDVKDVLIKVKELLSDKGRWTQGELARDTNGDSVRVDDPRAVKFCLIGALCRVCPDVDSRNRVSIYLRTICQSSPSYLNDYEGYTAVMCLLDDGIEDLEVK